MSPQVAPARRSSTREPRGTASIRSTGDQCDHGTAIGPHRARGASCGACLENARNLVGPRLRACRSREPSFEQHARFFEHTRARRGPRVFAGSAAPPQETRTRMPAAQHAPRCPTSRKPRNSAIRWCAYQRLRDEQDDRGRLANHGDGRITNRRVAGCTCSARSSPRTGKFAQAKRLRSCLDKSRDRPSQLAAAADRRGPSGARTHQPSEEPPRGWLAPTTNS